MMLEENNNSNVTPKNESNEKDDKIIFCEKQNIKNDLKEIRVSNTLCNLKSK